KRFDTLVAEPDVAILSLTITEGGYSLEAPNSTIEAIVSALDARQRAGGQPLTILSCDNLPHNGDVARHAIMTVAENPGRELARSRGGLRAGPRTRWSPGSRRRRRTKIACGSATRSASTTAGPSSASRSASG